MGHHRGLSPRRSVIPGPFEYSALVWGLALDWTLGRTLLEARALAGAAVIVASGIYLIRRERSARTARTAVAPDAICE